MGHNDPSVHQPLLRAVSIDDKYVLADGLAYLSGTQALVRLLINQAQRDKHAGWHTGGFVSGYRGSPLAGIDQALWAAGPPLEQHNVKFLPAVNEDLAATACWGTQQLMLFPDEATVEGVFALWYGKGPGLDRSGDALKHGNAAGTSAKGGVLVLAADDHTAKSSTFGHQSEQALVSAFIPVLYPSNVQEYLDFGVQGLAMSRYAGLWVGMKCVADVVETTSIADVNAHRVSVNIPQDHTIPPTGVHIRSPDVWADQEPRLVRTKLPAAIAYCRANAINRVVFKAEASRLGIICAGKAYNDVREAIRLLGWSEEEAARRGIAVLKLGMVWPLEPQIVREFAQGLDELLIVEEKRALVEQQVKDIFYADASCAKPVPRISGKSDGIVGGEFGLAAEHCLLQSDLELNPVDIAAAIVSRLRLTCGDVAVSGAAHLPVRSAAAGQAAIARKPYFCSGCPHNTSTQVPDGSRATAGIGCHYMASWMDRSTETYTHMGGEGVPWVAQSAFSTRKHVFANIGDGTYFHSGSLAIRQAVSAKNVNMTFKILYNDATAMTGGQPVDGPLTVGRLTLQLHAEGVVRIAVVSDDIEKYALMGIAFAPTTTVHHRGLLDQVQRELAAMKGVSALVYDQTCASEKRRRRKRQEYPDPPLRFVINPGVCEGCGDCSAKSNCLSVEPLETPLGRKRKINQSSCNKDYSCVDGFCPSFVAVEGGTPRRGQDVAAQAGQSKPALWEGLTTPNIRTLDVPCNVLVTGVGGTGVVTIGNLLGMAAHLTGASCTVLDMAGLAQKGGAVWSHVRLANCSKELDAARIAYGQADVMIGCDLVVSAQPDSISRLTVGRSRAVLSTDNSPTSDFVRNRDWELPEPALRKAVEDACGPGAVAWMPAQQLALKHLGDTVFANAIMLGHAWQQGQIPLPLHAMERAIEINGQAVKANLQAFRIGRWFAQDPVRVQATLQAAAVVHWHKQVRPDMQETIRHRHALLVQYQSPRYAQHYKNLLQELFSAIEIDSRQAFALAVASNLYKLMAYKDEYEVARLHSSPEFHASIAEQFEGEFKLAFHLAPPVFSRRNNKGHLQKRRFGPWMATAFRMLGSLKFLRGTWVDPFGHTHERKTERQLIEEYIAGIKLALPHIQDKSAQSLELARIPEHIRGYGHVKEASIVKARLRQRELILSITGSSPPTREDAGYGQFLIGAWS